jgi:DNA-binding transcriptional MerR regulator
MAAGVPPIEIVDWGMIRLRPGARSEMDKSADAFRTISEVAAELDLPQHVLRFWETRFPQIKPLKRAGGRRFYRPNDVEILRAIRRLLYGEGYTIKGVQRILKERGARALIAPGAAAPEDGAGFGPETLSVSTGENGEVGWAEDLFAEISPSDGVDLAIERRGQYERPLGEAPEPVVAARAEIIRRLKDIAGDLEACARMLDVGRRP